MRTVRILKHLRHVSSFSLLVRAFKKKRGELVVASQVIFLFTFILSVLLFQVEKGNNQSFSSVMGTLMWSISKYIGDIAGYGDFAPVTTWGQLIATLVGFLSVGIVAVAAGIMGSGLFEEVQEQDKEQQLLENLESLDRSFQVSVKDKASAELALQKRIRRGSININDLIVRCGISFEELAKLVNKTKGYRLRARKSESHILFKDMITVESFLHNKEYGGLKLNAQSNLWILSPDSFGERAIGFVNHTLANELDANYMSNECSGDVVYKRDEFLGNDCVNVLDEQMEVYKSNQAYLPDAHTDNQLLNAWMRDIKQHISSKDTVFIIRSCNVKHGKSFVIVNGGKKAYSLDHDRSSTSNLEAVRKFHDELSIHAEKQALGPVAIHEVFGNPKTSLLNFVRRETGADVIQIYINIHQIAFIDIMPPIRILAHAIKTAYLANEAKETTHD